MRETIEGDHTEPIFPVTPTGIYGALAEAAGAMKAIAKDQENTQQHFRFRSIETIVAHAKPILADLEISVTPAGFVVISQEEVKAASGTKGFRVVVNGHWKVAHTDGSYIEAGMLGEAVDYGDKATSKAVQMAYKYMLTQMLGIGSEDADSSSPEMVPALPEATQLEQRTNAVKAALLKEAKGDKEAAASVFTGILEYLNLTEPFKTIEEIELVEKGATGDERPM